MDDLDYSVDPSEDVPIWTQPKTTSEGFFSFDHELSEEVDGLPSFSQSFARPHIPPISLPKGATAIQDYSSHPPLPPSQALGEPSQHLGEQTLGASASPLPSSAGLFIPPSHAPNTSTFSAPVTTPPGKFTGIDSIPGFFDSIPVKTILAAKVSASQATAHPLGIPEASSNRDRGVSKRKRCLQLRSSEHFPQAIRGYPTDRNHEFSG